MFGYELIDEMCIGLENNCGDGVWDSKEECDDGPEIKPGCSGDCKKEPNYDCTEGDLSVCYECGNLNIDPIESCDDGTNDGRGCALDCKGVSKGWSCSGVKASSCSIIHGDGIIVSPDE